MESSHLASNEAATELTIIVARYRPTAIDLLGHVRWYNTGTLYNVMTRECFYQVGSDAYRSRKPR